MKNLKYVWFAMVARGLDAMARRAGAVIFVAIIAAVVLGGVLCPATDTPPTRYPPWLRGAERSLRARQPVGTVDGRPVYRSPPERVGLLPAHAPSPEEERPDGDVGGPPRPGRRVSLVPAVPGVVLLIVALYLVLRRSKRARAGAPLGPATAAASAAKTPDDELPPTLEELEDDEPTLAEIEERVEALESRPVDVRPSVWFWLWLLVWLGLATCVVKAVWQLV